MSIDQRSFLDGRVTLYAGDCLAVLDTLSENSIDSCVTDPPYHLASIVKRFGKEGSAAAQHGTDGLYARASRGFMGKEWDGGDIAFDPVTWAEVLRVLKPGAHLVAFAAAKNAHRMICAIEDAGFEIRDCLQWLYGSGFPKSHNLKDEWAGWGTALKPAFEPICLARKPLSEASVAANVLRWGTGALNIDGCRVETDENRARMNNARTDGTSYIVQREAKFIDPGGNGRWPANICLSYPEDEYALRRDITPEERRDLYGWLSENA